MRTSLKGPRPSADAVTMRTAPVAMIAVTCAALIAGGLYFGLSGEPDRLTMDEASAAALDGAEDTTTKLDGCRREDELTVWCRITATAPATDGADAVSCSSTMRIDREDGDVRTKATEPYCGE